MLDEIMYHMEHACLSGITESLRTLRYVMQKTYESLKDNKDEKDNKDD